MIKLLRVASSKFDKLKRLVVTVWNGGSDVLTAEEYGPYGVDSRPIKDIIAAYTRSAKDGDDLIIGVLNKDRKAEVGEIRLFSTNSSGVLKFNVWLRNDGFMLAGASGEPADYTNFAVLFNEMKTEFNSLKSDHNTLAQKWNAFCNSYTPGSPSTTGLPPTLTTSTVSLNTSNIDNAKHPKIKYDE